MPIIWKPNNLTGMLLLVFKGGGNTSLIIMAFRNWIPPVTARLSSVTLMIIAEFILSIFGSPLILLLSPPHLLSICCGWVCPNGRMSAGGLGTTEQALSSPGPFQSRSFILCLYLELLSRGQHHTSAPIVTVYATTASCGPCKKDEQWRQLEFLCS